MLVAVWEEATVDPISCYGPLIAGSELSCPNSADRTAGFGSVCSEADLLGKSLRNFPCKLSGHFTPE